MKPELREAKKTELFCERCKRNGIKTKATTLTNHYLIGILDVPLCDNCIKTIRKKNGI